MTDREEGTFREGIEAAVEIVNRIKLDRAGILHKRRKHELAEMAFDTANEIECAIRALLPPDSDSVRVMDTEAVAWAYGKLLVFGVQNGKMESAMMMDRLQAMLAAQERREG